MKDDTLADKIRRIRWAFPVEDQRREDIELLADEADQLSKKLAESLASDDTHLFEAAALSAQLVEAEATVDAQKSLLRVATILLAKVLVTNDAGVAANADGREADMRAAAVTMERTVMPAIRAFLTGPPRDTNGN